MLLATEKMLLSKKMCIRDSSLCDLNGHVNNACYLDIACDALPLEVIKGGPLKFVSVKYHREIPLGSQVEVFYAPSALSLIHISSWNPTRVRCC